MNEPPLRAKLPVVTSRPLTSDFSYNAMLQSYARKIDKPMYAGGSNGGNIGGILEEDSSYENIEPPLKGSNLAQEMNFEVVNPDDYISPETRTVRLLEIVSIRRYITSLSPSFSPFTLSLSPFPLLPVLSSLFSTLKH